MLNTYKRDTLMEILEGFAWVHMCLCVFVCAVSITCVIGICIHLRSNILPNNVDVRTLTIHFQMGGVNVCSISPTLVFSIITKGSIC